MLCFCSKCPRAPRFHQHCSVSIPDQNGLLSLVFLPSKGPPDTAGQRSLAKVTLAPGKPLLLFSPLLFDWKRLRGTCWVVIAFCSTPLRTLPVLLLGLRMNWVPAPVLINNKSKTWNLMQLRGFPDGFGIGLRSQIWSRVIPNLDYSGRRRVFLVMSKKAYVPSGADWGLIQSGPPKSPWICPGGNPAPWGCPTCTSKGIIQSVHDGTRGKRLCLQLE